jgi:hypothetical protein
VRLAKGQKRPKKKDAVVMALDAVNPDQPTPQDDVVAALLQDASRPALATRPAACRPRPAGPPGKWRPCAGWCSEWPSATGQPAARGAHRWR